MEMSLLFLAIMNVFGVFTVVNTENKFGLEKLTLSDLLSGRLIKNKETHVPDACISEEYISEVDVPEVDVSEEYVFEVDVPEVDISEEYIFEADVPEADVSEDDWDILSQV